MVGKSKGKSPRATRKTSGTEDAEKTGMQTSKKHKIRPKKSEIRHEIESVRTSRDYESQIHLTHFMAHDVPVGNLPSGFNAGGVPVDTALTMDEAMAGVVSDDEQGGSGATGGPLTGEMTDSGMSSDLTEGFVGGGSYGGPTGGDIYGGGAGSGTQKKAEDILIAEGGDVTGPNPKKETGMSKKVMAQNTKNKYMQKP